MLKRASGVLLPVFSLPSPYGVGTLGEEAYRFIDFLKEAGQSYWQVLPMGPTSLGDSPYQSFSSFAGNPYFIDPRQFLEEGFLLENEIAAFDFGKDGGRVDYGKLYENRFSLLRKAYERGKETFRGSMEEFCEKNPWVVDYALFMSIKKSFGMKPVSGWESEALKKHNREALLSFRQENAGEVDFWIFLQTVFYAQWEKLRAYAREKNIRFIGDLPIYTAMDSADVWSEPEMFDLSEDLSPNGVAGVPPDAFSDEGQLWGNPLYDYEQMRNDGFGWWIRRIDGASKLYDVIRIDHFRGFESYWRVESGAGTAKEGKWVKGPGMDLVGVITSWFPDLSFIAEDLGIITEDVRELLAASGLPGMKVLQFAFESGKESRYLPHNIEKNSVCYIGTHDNDTACGFAETMSAKDRRFAREYMHVTRGEGIPHALLRTGMESCSDLFIVTVQDLLGLSGAGRINTPGTFCGNWTWRMSPEDFEDLFRTAGDLRHMTELYSRIPVGYN